jgi:polysaccharide biosynthesis protein PslH
MARFPEARLTLAGAGLDSTVLQLIDAADGISAAVGVDSVVPFLLSADVFVSPISSGYGSKLKMIEALRAACVIVCCPESLRGLPNTAKQAVIVARSSELFAKRIATLLPSPELRNELAMKAARVAAELPTWDDAAEGMLRGWRHTIEKGTGSSSFLARV